MVLCTVQNVDSISNTGRFLLTFENSVVVIKTSLLCFQVQCMQFSPFALPSIVKWRQCLKKYKGHICSNFFIQFVYKVSNFKAILMSNDLKSCKRLMKKEDVTLNKINCPSKHHTCTLFSLRISYTFKQFCLR